MIHELKTLPKYFKAVMDGEKTFEIRTNDRPFQKGDLLALNEYDGQAYTGNSCLVAVDYILDDPEYVKKDMVVMAIKPCNVKTSSSMMDSYYKVPFATQNDKKSE